MGETLRRRAARSIRTMKSTKRKADRASPAGPVQAPAGGVGRQHTAFEQEAGEIDPLVEAQESGA
jgi:hypothetical protein